MSSFCKQCGICCKLIPVLKTDGRCVRDDFQSLDSEFLKGLIPVDIHVAEEIDKSYVELILKMFPNVKFYSCSHLMPNNKCEMGSMPEFCKKFPSSPLALLPENCGYCGYIFLLREELKSRVRKIKEEILDYETLVLSGDKNSKSYKKIADNLKRFVNKYSDFGSSDW